MTSRPPSQQHMIRNWIGSMTLDMEVDCIYDPCCAMFFLIATGRDGVDLGAVFTSGQSSI
jgi:hypothetical protein